MKMVKYSTVCILGLMLFLVSCSKDPVYPVEPSIAFTSFTKIQNNTGKDQKGILKISFTDGDGDIGLNQDDTQPPYDTASVYFYNMFITYYEKQHGIYVPVTLPISNNARVPQVPPATKGLPLQGDIEIELYINNPATTFDTIKYDAYIVDRALHVSNVISTPDIIISK